MRFYWLIISVLCVWRITHLLQAEDGPGDLMVHFRRQAGMGFLGKLLDCFYCLSLWLALPFAFVIGQTWRERLILWPAYSAGAILLERLTSREDKAVTPPLYLEDENEDALLRKSESETTRTN